MQTITTPWVILNGARADRSGSRHHEDATSNVIQAAPCAPAKLRSVRIETEIELLNTRPIFQYALENSKPIEQPRVNLGYGGYLHIVATRMRPPGTPGMTLAHMLHEQYFASDMGGPIPPYDGSPDFAGPSTINGGGNAQIMSLNAIRKPYGISGDWQENDLNVTDAAMFCDETAPTPLVIELSAGASGSGIAGCNEVWRVASSAYRVRVRFHYGIAD